MLHEGFVQTQTRVQTITIPGLRLMYINDHTWSQYSSKRKQNSFLVSVLKHNLKQTILCQVYFTMTNYKQKNKRESPVTVQTVCSVV